MKIFGLPVEEVDDLPTHEIVLAGCKECEGTGLVVVTRVEEGQMFAYVCECSCLRRRP